MLQTDLTHLLSAEDLKKKIEEKENVMVCCGRMGPMCIPVYDSMEKLRDEYSHVEFCDMEFDSPEAEIIRSLPECKDFMGLPFTIYYKNGKVAAATTSIQTKDKITAILDREFQA